jgi:hypothetical protein
VLLCPWTFFVCELYLTVESNMHDEQACNSHEMLLDKFFVNPRGYFGNLPVQEPKNGATPWVAKDVIRNMATKLHSGRSHSDRATDPDRNDATESSAHTPRVPGDEVVVEAGASPASPRGPVLQPRLWNQVRSNLSQLSAVPLPPPGAGAAPAAPGYKTWAGRVGCESVKPDEPLCLPDIAPCERTDAGEGVHS